MPGHDTILEELRGTCDFKAPSSSPTSLILHGKKLTGAVILWSVFLSLLSDRSQ